MGCACWQEWWTHTRVTAQRTLLIEIGYALGRGDDLAHPPRHWPALLQAAAALGKPLVLEEYGKLSLEYEIPTIRDPWFRLAHEALEVQLASGGE